MATLQLPQQDSSHFYLFIFCFVCFFALLGLSSKFGFDWVGCKGRGQMQGEKEIRGIGMPDEKPTKNQ